MMNKERIHKEISEIEVPKDEIFRAIEKGMERGRNKKAPNKKSKVRLYITVGTIAATAFLTSGLIFAPISNALSSIPILGSIYEKVGLQIGYELLESDLITELNQHATSNGVDITITSAYYDGNIIGITFNARGEKVLMESVGDEGPETGYDFHLFDGKEKNQWSASMTNLIETDDGYIASIEFYNPNANLSKNYTLPLTFTYITGVKGAWKFDIPVEKIDSETIYSRSTTELEDQGYSLKMESVVKGKATTILNYQTTLPLVGKKDSIEITVFDDEGQRLSKFQPNVLRTVETETSVVQDNQELFSSKISKDTKYLTVQPEIVKWDEDIVKSMEYNTPFMIKSNRFNYSLLLNNIQQKGDHIIVDYYIQNTNTIKGDIIQNFADFIMIAKTTDIQKNEDGEVDMDKILEHKILRDSAKSMDDNHYHYQSTFNLKNLKKFDYRDYSLVVPFGTLSANDKPIKMESIKVELK